jgi:hypothetical protein
LIEDILGSLEKFLKSADLGEIEGTLVILERDRFRIRRRT